MRPHFSFPPSSWESRGYLSKSDFNETVFGEKYFGISGWEGPAILDRQVILLVGLEALNVGGWLTRGETASETSADIIGCL